MSAPVIVPKCAPFGTRKATCSPEVWAAHLAYMRERQAIYRPKNPEKRREHDREYQRRRYLKTKADPEKLALRRQWEAERRRKARVAAKASTPLAPIRTSLEAAMTDTAFRSIWDAMPGAWPLAAREDIASEAMILLLEGAAASPAEAVKLGSRRHWSLFTRFGSVSLDEPVREGLTRLDLLAADEPEDIDQLDWEDAA